MPQVKTQKKVEINKKTPSVRLCVYGTLRSGRSNNYLLGDSELLGTYRTEPGYTMYSTGGFPMVDHDNSDNTIEYEVFEVKDQIILERIHRLEGCTGIVNHPHNWYNIEPMQTPHGTCYIYTQEDQGYPQVKSGNWNKF